MRPSGIPIAVLVTAAAALCAGPAVADVLRPQEVAGLRVEKSGDDLLLTWTGVTTDVLGNTESLDFYAVYRGATPDFVPDKAGAGNRVGSPSGPSFLHLDVGTDGADHFYLVSAVDTSGNEGNTRPSKAGGAPTLSGSWTDTTIDLSWTGASGNAAGFNVYYGRSTGGYESVDDVGSANSHSLSGLQMLVNWYSVVAAYDAESNETIFSNEHVDAVAGRVSHRVHDGHELCWGAAKCPPGPGEVQRSDGAQLMVPTTFPEGDWQRVLVTFTVESRLCDPPAGSNVTKCGSGNPCLSPPCNGGYNTCGDPWDRRAELFLVLDEACITSGSCINDANLELMRAVTPFGTDADPPDGTGFVPPRALTLDITPFAPQLTGTKYVGVNIGHFVQTGWWVTVDFEFSERDDEASPKPPADGFQQVFYRGGGEILTPVPVTIPATAQQVIGRFFITGHGGSAFCDGGWDDGQSCAGGCPGGGFCQNCDEFCHRDHIIRVDGATAWKVEPWRNDCSPAGNPCSNWNACGTTSCTFPRAGWCPGYVACHHEDPCDQDRDLTHRLQPGGTYDMTWAIPVRNGSWSKSLAVYWYESSNQSCGNGIREGSELCDGDDTGSVTCPDQGWDSGTLGCNPTCDGFDESACQLFSCGNTICEAQAGEDCLSCPDDCNGKQQGNPQSKFCCGDGDGVNPSHCGDPRCTGDGNTCEP